MPDLGSRYLRFSAIEVTLYACKLINYSTERIEMAKVQAKAPESVKREYKTPESAALQKAQYEKKGYSVTRKGNTLYLKKGKSKK
jgi:hypothetical protein